MNDAPVAGFQAAGSLRRGVATTNFPRVHDVKFQVQDFAPRKGLSRELNHLRRSINANDGAARRGLGNFSADLAVAAADIENVLVPAQLELRDEFARPGLLHGGIRGVISRVPLGGWRNRFGHW